jgi:hypothetical protein
MRMDCIKFVQDEVLSRAFMEMGASQSHDPSFSQSAMKLARYYGLFVLQTEVQTKREVLSTTSTACV